MQKITKKYQKFSVVDLFCGVGGLTQGFVQENFNVTAGVDTDISCLYAYEKNNQAKFIAKSVTDLQVTDLLPYYKDTKLKILVGCAPCQDFSIYNKNNKPKNREEQSEKLGLEKSDKWKLLYEYSRIINELQPEIISMENVPQLQTYEKGQVLQDFIENLSNTYNLTYKIVDAQDYGVPQRRKRFILLGCKKDKGRIDIISPEEFKNSGIKVFKNVREAIGDLPEIEDGESLAKDKLHIARKLNELNKKRIMASKQGGTWHDWTEDLILDCHKKESGKSFKSVYGRMRWDEVAPTMTTYCIGLGNGRFGHPEQHRAISLREAALFQTFPENYSFINPTTSFSMATIARQIGNAVPVYLGRVIAQSIKKHIESTNYE